jgi:DNA-binding CsgD family transcriptional regulator/tetratricopeptide (TPR) repeat protein
LCPVVVGRDAELQAIESCLAAAQDGRGSCIVLTGEPGIGKSRLARELARLAADRGATVVAGRAVPAGASVPYRPLTEALLQGLRGRAFPVDPELAPWVPALAAIVPGVNSSEKHAADSSLPARGEAVVQLLRRLADPAGLVVVLEDLHWADPDTVAVVEYLGDNLAGAPILCVLTSRDEPATPTLDLVRRQRGRSGVTHLPLGRLDPAGMADMVRACAPDAGAELVARVQRAAEGIPLLVEELLASPGLPGSFVDTVRERLAGFDAAERSVLDASAVLGRHFDWELLSPMTGQPPDVVTDALSGGVERLLLSVNGNAFSFRHALTREAILESLLPPRHRALAEAGLAAVDTVHPRLDGPWRELAADLAARAGDRNRAGLLMASAGRTSLERGALATAIDTLRRAADLLEGNDERAQTELVLVEALALAGRVEEAAAVGVRLIERLGRDPAMLAPRVEVHLRLAHAAVAASRWAMARHQLDSAESLAGGADISPASRARLDVLHADVAFSADDTELARRLAEGALNRQGVGPEVRCHALEIIGRAERFDDIAAARGTFERALATAEAADLPLWRLRALHELGTIDMLDHAGCDRLQEARRAAERLGALSTVAVLDLQLSALFTCHWALEQAEVHGRSAVAIADRLGLGQVRAKAFAMLAGTASMRDDRVGTERCITLSLAAAPDDKMLDGMAWGGRGMLALLAGDTAGALKAFSPGMAIFARLPHAEPAALRAVWPLLLASVGDRRAPAAVEECRRLGVSAFNLNRGLVAYAEAVLAGRAGNKQRAEELVALADRGFANCEAWAELARALAAESAINDGWGDPRRWLASAGEGFARRGLPRLADLCRVLLTGAGEPNPWAAIGVTAREAEVLQLVAEGLPNKEIAARLEVSPRTVEKHVESLLRKTAARSRTELAVMASGSTMELGG